MINKIRAYIRLKRSRGAFKLRKAELYKGIESLPVWNYYKVIETNNLKYMAKSEDYSKPFKYDKAQAFINWERISDQFIEVFGVSREQKDALLDDIEMAIAYYEWKIERIPSARSRYELLRKQKEKELKASNEKGTLKNQIFYIEREMGFKIDEKTLSVKDFFNYINNLSEIAKSIKQQRDGKKIAG